MKLGAYYWDGWYAKIPHWTDRLLTEFADREPVWGWLGNTVENMELQIDYAVNGGLSFFAFDWYYPENGHINPMNNAVDRFLLAKNSKDMNFCLLIANHSGGFIYKENWEDACERFMPYLIDERSLRVDGKPVIIFFSSYDLSRCLGGAEETKRCLESLREKARQAGLPGVIVIGCENPPRDSEGNLDLNPERWTQMLKQRESEGLDALTGYNYHREHVLCGDKKVFIYPYEDLAKDHSESWDAFAKYSKLPYMPIVISGWDCRPWETLWQGAAKPHPRSCYSPDRTPTQIYNHVIEAGNWIKNNPQNALEDLAIIYAWNENGEGGYIVPTIGDNGRILQAIYEAVNDINK